MALVATMNRAGIGLVKVIKRGDGRDHTTLMVRAPSSDVQRDVWNRALIELLSAAEGQEWKVDVSKVFFLADGIPRYLWRFILTVNVPDAVQALEQAIHRAMAGSVEVTSMPLIGRSNQPADAATGRFKGVRTENEVAQALSLLVPTGPAQ